MTTSAPRFCSLRRAGQAGAYRPGNMRALSATGFAADYEGRAAVRQPSIALITFICSRLTCPALALRHAAPWSRNISATSRPGRDMVAAC
jgi:hypothetical protein